MLDSSLKEGAHWQSGTLSGHAKGPISEGAVIAQR